MTEKDERRLRRLAMEIAIQLPDNREEALKVLKYSEKLVSEYLEPLVSGSRQGDNVIVRLAPPGP